MTQELKLTTLPTEVEKKMKVAIELKKELEKYEAELKTIVLDYMKQNDVDTIKSDLYTISKVKRNNYKASEIPADFSKTVLDTAKVGKHEALYGELPDGVEKTVTEYVSWRSK